MEDTTRVRPVRSTMLRPPNYVIYDESDDDDDSERESSNISPATTVQTASLQSRPTTSSGIIITPPLITTASSSTELDFYSHSPYSPVDDTADTLLLDNENNNDDEEEEMDTNRPDDEEESPQSSTASASLLHKKIIVSNNKAVVVRLESTPFKKVSNDKADDDAFNKLMDSYKSSKDYFEKKIDSYKQEKIKVIKDTRTLKYRNQVIEARHKMCKKLLAHVKKIDKELIQSKKTYDRIINNNKIKLHDIDNSQKSIMTKYKRIVNTQGPILNEDFGSCYQDQLKLMNVWSEYELECPICNCSDQTLCRLRNCDHIICAQCAPKVFVSSASCPICRSEVEYIEYKFNGKMKIKRLYVPFKFRHCELEEIFKKKENTLENDLEIEPLNSDLNCKIFFHNLISSYTCGTNVDFTTVENFAHNSPS